MMNKRTIACLVIAIMMLSLLAGCQSGNPGTTAPAATTAATTTANANATADPASDEPAGKLLPEPVTLNMWIEEHPSYLYIPDLLVEREIGEQLNIFFNITPFQEGIVDKINLGMASGDLPDLMFSANLNNATIWGMQGAAVDLTQYSDDMPNYNAWAASMGDYPRYYYSANGSLYIAPQHGFGTASNSTFWIYRQDLFEKHNLAVPTNEMELYEVSKALKAEYPDAYPFGNRSWSNGLPIVDRIAYQWGTGSYIYYSNDEQAWVCGATDEQYRKCIEWLAMMYKEELMPPNILSLDTAGWQEMVSTNKAFIFSEYQARIDFFNSPMRETDPSVTFAYMTPFQGGDSGVTSFNPQTQLIIMGYLAFTTSDYVPEMIQYIDWLYTPQAKELLSWGVEGESFTINSDGTKSHIGIKQGDSGFIYQGLYGFFQRGFWCINDPEAFITYASDETLNAVAHVLTDAGEYRIPAISFSEANQEKVNVIAEPIKALHDEYIGKFITGQLPMSEYDNFLTELEKLGLSDLLQLYNDQQAEINANF